MQMKYRYSIQAIFEDSIQLYHMYQNLSIHSPINGHLGVYSFRPLWMKYGILYIFVSCGYIPRRGMAWPYVKCLFNFFFEIVKLFSKVLMGLYLSISNEWEFHCPMCSPAQNIASLLKYSHTTECGIFLWLNLSYWWPIMLSLLSRVYWRFVYILCDIPVQTFACILLELLWIVGVIFLISYRSCKYFPFVSYLSLKVSWRVEFLNFDKI